MTSPRISIIGSALSGNKGAAAMLESAIENVGARVPDVQFTLFSMYPAEDSALNTYPNLEIVAAAPRQLGVTINLLALTYKILPPLRPLIRKKSRAIRALTSSSVLVDQGGITFSDGREKFLLYNVASILPAFMVKTPVFKCAQAIGPFTSKINRTVSRIFLPKVSRIITRGAITHELAENFGLTNITAGADLAFALPLSGKEKDEIAGIVDLSFFDNSDVVGISPSVVVQKKIAAQGGDYLRMLEDLIVPLTKSGTPVAIIPHSVRLGTTSTHNNDLPLCRELFERLEAAGADTSRLLLVDQELTSQQLRYLIGRCDTFVASRFHAMISSLSVGVPTLVIGWSHKYTEVLDMFGLAQWAFGFDQLTGDELSQRFAELRANKTEISAQIKKALPGVIDLALQQADMIADYTK